MSEPPKLELTTLKKQTVQISGTVGAGPGTGLTLVAGPITMPYRVTGAEIIFRNDTASLLQLYLLISRDTTISTTTPPADTNLFSPYTPASYFIGEGVIKRVSCSVKAENGQNYLKVHAINGCAYAQTVNVSIEIEEVKV